jgi:UDP-N-acetylmuramoyl-tripeptide--D-alanyl-D-alanine ligase
MDGEVFEVIAPLRGAFCAENIAATIAVAHLSGLCSGEIYEGIARVELPKHRFIASRLGDFLAIDDTYNANPLSMQRMLEAAAEQAGSKPLVLVLGEMLELGASTQSEHETLGRRIARIGAAAVFWKGGQHNSVQSGLAAEGFRKPFIVVQDSAAFLKAFDELNLKQGLVLFKGSRSNKLEEFYGAFEQSMLVNDHAHASPGADAKQSAEK